MTALNKAFIKAYTKDEPHAPVPRPHFAVQPGVEAKRQAARKSADRIVAEQRTQSAESAANSAAVQLLIPSPTLGPALFAEPTSNREDVARETEPVGLAMNLSDEETLPSVTKIPLASVAHVRATFEVDQVAWPKICPTLSTKIGDELDAVTSAFARPRGGGSQIIGLAGVDRGVGCTTIAITLAHHLCQRRSVAADAEVLIIDANLENSELATSLGLAPQFCWNDTADGSVPLEDALIESLTDRMMVMPLATGAQRSSQPMDTRKLSADLAALASQHRTIFIDLGSLTDADNAGVLEAVGGRLDTLLLVHDARVSDDSQMKEATDLAAQVGLNVSGIIENWSADSARTTKAA